jgi:hypothetical protein
VSLQFICTLKPSKEKNEHFLHIFVALEPFPIHNNCHMYSGLVCYDLFSSAYQGMAMMSVSVLIENKNNFTNINYLIICRNRARATFQTLRLWLFTSDPRVQCRVILCYIHGWRNGTGEKFSSSSFCFPMIIMIPPLLDTHPSPSP